jgi:hypothetical protein
MRPCTYCQPLTFVSFGDEISKKNGNFTLEKKEGFSLFRLIFYIGISFVLFKYFILKVVLFLILISLYLFQVNIFA